MVHIGLSDGEALMHSILETVTQCNASLEPLDDEMGVKLWESISPLLQFACTFYRLNSQENSKLAIEALASIAKCKSFAPKEAILAFLEALSMATHGQFQLESRFQPEFILAQVLCDSPLWFESILSRFDEKSDRRFLKEIEEVMVEQVTFILDPIGSQQHLIQSEYDDWSEGEIGSGDEKANESFSFPTTCQTIVLHAGNLSKLLSRTLPSEEVIMNLLSSYFRSELLAKHEDELVAVSVSVLSLLSNPISFQSLWEDISKGEKAERDLMAVSCCLYLLYLKGVNVKLDGTDHLSVAERFVSSIPVQKALLSSSIARNHLISVQLCDKLTIGIDSGEISKVYPVNAHSSDLENLLLALSSLMPHYQSLQRLLMAVLKRIVLGIAPEDQVLIVKSIIARSPDPNIGSLFLMLVKELPFHHVVEFAPVCLRFEGQALVENLAVSLSYLNVLKMALAKETLDDQMKQLLSNFQAHLKSLQEELKHDLEHNDGDQQAITQMKLAQMQLSMAESLTQFLTSEHIHSEDCGHAH
jgi:hypothetical protein